MKSVRGRVAAITGAGSGIGRATLGLHAMKRSDPVDAPGASRRRAAHETPLARRHETSPRATPQALFSLALDWWRRGERFDIGRMAQALEVSRATLFRWAGTRELLYGEVLSSLFERALDTARREARGEGAELITDVTRRLLRGLVSDVPLRHFVQQDAEYALRVLMSRDSTVQRRATARVHELLEEAVRTGHLQPAMKLESLAYVLLRIGESFLYRDALTGEPPDVEAAITAIHILLSSGNTK